MNIDISESELPEDWFLLSESQSDSMSEELANETCSEHQLHGLKSKAIARKDGRDDFLFIVNGATSPLYVVHLTWQKETSPNWPHITPFESKDDFLQNWRRIFD
jgi:hypothetical protein